MGCIICGKMIYWEPDRWVNHVTLPNGNTYCEACWTREQYSKLNRKYQNRMLIILGTALILKVVAAILNLARFFG